jgi:hypothetical protein
MGRNRVPGVTKVVTLGEMVGRSIFWERECSRTFCGGVLKKANNSTIGTGKNLAL